MKASDLFVFCARFNPISWKTPQRLFEEWTTHMLDSGVKLTVIECQYGERPYCCNISPHINHIGLRADSWAWTKENLINIGIARVPEAKYICWSDSDVWHRRSSWAVETVHALQHYRFIQPWSDAYDLGPNDEHLAHFKSFCWAVANGKTLIPDRHGWKHAYDPYPHPGYCITEGTEVQPGGRIYGATSRFWEGDIVVLRTAAGHELAVTPNHPILTEHGWEPAAAIDVCDYVFSARSGHRVAVEGDEQYVPASIQDIARSFAQAPGISRATTPTRPEHFHGDGAGSEVTVIWTDRLLRDAIEADLAKDASQQAFGLGLVQTEAFLRQRSPALLVEALDLTSPASEVADRGNLLAPLFGNVREHAAADSRSYFRAARGAVGVPSSLMGLSSGSENTTFLEPIISRRRVHADDPRGLRAALASSIERDQVVYVGVRKFSGHVYNLSTERGFIIASNILTHNCWASTRRVLEYPGGLFELGGMGASDHAMALALVGKAAASAPRNSNASYIEALKTWQDRLLPAVNGRIGFVHGTIEHHFHGAKKSRGYLSRWAMFLRHGFDPIADLKRNTFGVLEFAGNKPELEREWDLYLRSRNEDANYAGD